MVASQKILDFSDNVGVHMYHATYNNTTNNKTKLNSRSPYIGVRSFDDLRETWLVVENCS